jgi:hypothetical protein
LSLDFSERKEKKPSHIDARSCIFYPFAIWNWTVLLAVANPMAEEV